MGQRLQLIEQKVKAINSAEFQNLCDAYLNFRENRIVSFNRTGSQLGKQKTIPGTPDCFFRFENKLIYIEYTTQSDNKVSKIKSDIDSCLNIVKTGVDVDEFSELIICINSRLSALEEVEIFKYSQLCKVNIELIGIDKLSMDIFSKYPLLSKEFLGIPIDTGQIQNLEKFIEEYNNKAKQLSTPLDNEFFHRNNELFDIYKYLNSGDFLILSGAPGVGKTKIALKAITDFVDQNNSYIPFAISNKNVDISEDIRIQLSIDKDYILLIDDANRQISNLNQILGIYKERRNGNFKIIVTIRNYALTDFYKIVNSYKIHIVEIKKFSDDEIVKIIESDSFRIINKLFQEKIVRISDGNARLAIMAARLAKLNQSAFLFGNVLELFDSYFESFISDYDLFNDKEIVKVLGIISFFYSININDKDFIEKLLDTFEVDYYIFSESIDELHRRELIEVQANCVRISDQIMAVYFFYIVFIKYNILSFKVLLYSYFISHKYYFRESIISANNILGYENVMSRIKQDLLDYFNSISSNEDAIINFIDLFWFYLQEETINFFYNKVKQLKEPQSFAISVCSDMNDYTKNENVELDLISNFYCHSTEWLGNSIELGFEYVRKRPKCYSKFEQLLKECFIFDESDEVNEFRRQRTLMEIVSREINNNNWNYITSFFTISKTFLKFSFRKSSWSKRNRINLYNYSIPYCIKLIELRKSIWDILFSLYGKFPNEVFDVLKDYINNNTTVVSKLVDSDLNLLVPFILEKFSPRNFKHVLFIHDMIFWININSDIKNKSYKSLERIFNTIEYTNYTKLNSSYLNGKLDFDSENADNLKIRELKDNFIFISDVEFEILFSVIENAKSIDEDCYFSLINSLDIVVYENYIRNDILGFKLFKLILRNYPIGNRLFYKSLSAIVSSSSDQALELWNELQINKENNLVWRICFFYYLPDSLINKFYCNLLYDTILSIDMDVSIILDLYSRFLTIDKNIFYKILKVIVDKIEIDRIKIDICCDLFETKIFVFNDDYELIKKTYFQQFVYKKHGIYDKNAKSFKKIFELYPSFFKDFIRDCFIQINNGKYKIRLNFIWNDISKFDLIEELFDLMISERPYRGINDHSIHVFFTEINQNQILNALCFIKHYLQINLNNPSKVDIIFDVIRSCLNGNFEELLLFYIDLKPDFETFKMIDWVGSIGAHLGNVNFSEMYAKKWERILDIINIKLNSFDMIPFKHFLNKRITENYKSAEIESDRRFSFPY